MSSKSQSFFRLIDMDISSKIYLSPKILNWRIIQLFWFNHNVVLINLRGEIFRDKNVTESKLAVPAISVKLFVSEPVWFGLGHHGCLAFLKPDYIPAGDGHRDKEKWKQSERVQILCERVLSAKKLQVTI